MGEDTLQAPYLDTTRSVEERVRDLLSRMTFDEKLAQIGCVWSSSVCEDGAFSESPRAREAGATAPVT